MNKQILKNYITLLTANNFQIKPYFDVLGDDLPIYETIYNTEQFIAELLDISEDIQNIIREYVAWVIYGDEIFLVCDEDGNKILTLDGIADYVIRLMEAINE